MTAPVVHINLLQRTATVPTVPLALAALLALTLLGTAYHASELRAEAQEALQRLVGPAMWRGRSRTCRRAWPR